MIADAERMDARIPPHNLEAEKLLIAGVLVDSRRWLDVENVPAEWFYRHAHQRIWLAIRQLAEANRPVGTVSLADALGRAGALEKVGGPVYLDALTKGMPLGANVKHAASIVYEHWQYRQLLTIATQMADDAYQTSEPIETKLAKAEGAILHLAGNDTLARTTYPIDELSTNAFTRLEQRTQHTGGVIGIPTGWRALDYVTEGWQPGRVVLVGGGTSNGKSSFALQTALAAARAGRSVAYFSLEMTAQQLHDRATCLTSGVSNKRYLRPACFTADESKRVGIAISELSNLPLMIDDQSRVKPNDIRQRVRLRARETGAPVDLVVVDYVQLAQSDRRQENRQLEVSDVSRRLKELAKELNTCVLALSQFNRLVEDGTEPQLAHLRESGSLEQDCDIALLLWRPNQSAEEQSGAQVCDLQIKVAKNRDGERGSLRLYFHGATYHFSEDPQERSA